MRARSLHPVSPIDSDTRRKRGTRVSAQPATTHRSRRPGGVPGSAGVCSAAAAARTKQAAFGPSSTAFTMSSRRSNSAIVHCHVCPILDVHHAQHQRATRLFGVDLHMIYYVRSLSSSSWAATRPARSALVAETPDEVEWLSVLYMKCTCTCTCTCTPSCRSQTVKVAASRNQPKWRLCCSTETSVGTLSAGHV